MNLIVECNPAHRLADLIDVKLALLELGYRLTITPRGDLLAQFAQEATPTDITRAHKPAWPPRALRSAP